jgi:hypothetical protein
MFDSKDPLTTNWLLSRWKFRTFPSAILFQCTNYFTNCLSPSWVIGSILNRIRNLYVIKSWNKYMTRWRQPSIWNKSVDGMTCGMTCAWSNTFYQSNWNIWIMNNRCNILNIINFLTWMYLSRFWIRFKVLVKSKRYWVLYLLSRSFPLSINMKLMILCWFKMFIDRGLNWSCRRMTLDLLSLLKNGVLRS